MLNRCSKHLICAAIAVLAFGFGAAIEGSAQQPSQINLIVGFAPGGSADSVARVVGNKAAERTGTRILVENRAGAGGNNAAKVVVGAQADGSIVLVTTAALAINETLMKNKGFSVDALRTVAIAASTPEVIAINGKNPAKNLAEFIQMNKDKGINFGTAGVGTGSHIIGEYFFKTTANMKAVHVPFRGGPDAVNALLGEHVDLVASSLSGFAAQVASGELRGLAIATEKRFPVIPNVPTYTEAGYPKLIASSWVGFFAPAKTPDDVVAKLNAAIVEALRDDEVKKRLVAIGFEPMSGVLQESEAFFKAEVDQWGKMVRSLGLSVE